MPPMAGTRPGIELATAHGSTGRPATPSEPRSGAPGRPTPGAATPGTTCAPDGPGPLGGAARPGAITLAAPENGVGGSPTCAAGATPACAAGPDGVAVSGIRTDATFSHPLAHVPPPGSGALTEVSGVRASVPPRRAAAAAPRTVILMTDPSSSRLAIGTGQCQELKRTRPLMRGLSEIRRPARWCFQLTDGRRCRDARQPDDGRRLMQAFLPFGVGIGVGGDPAADPQHRVSDGVELYGSDRDVELAPGDRGRQTNCATVYSATPLLPLRNQLAGT